MRLSFNRLHLIPGLLVVHEVDGDTLASESTRTTCINLVRGCKTDDGGLRTDTVDVCLDVDLCIALVPRIAPIQHELQIIVNDHVDLRNIDSPRNHIRRDKDFILSSPKPVNDSITFMRILRAVQARDMVTIRDHPSRDLVRSVATHAEDDALADGEALVK